MDLPYLSTSDPHGILEPLLRNLMWIKVLGVVLLVKGVIGITSLIYVVSGAIAVALGVVLLLAASRLQRWESDDSEMHALQCVGKISLFFKISSVVMLIGVVFTVGLLLIAILFVLALA